MNNRIQEFKPSHPANEPVDTWGNTCDNKSTQRRLDVQRRDRMRELSSENNKLKDDRGVLVTRIESLESDLITAQKLTETLRDDKKVLEGQLITKQRSPQGSAKKASQKNGKKSANKP